MPGIKISQSQPNHRAINRRGAVTEGHCEHHGDNTLLRISTAYYCPRLRRYRQARAAILARVPGVAGERMVADAVHKAVWDLDGVVPGVADGGVYATEANTG